MLTCLREGNLCGFLVEGLNQYFNCVDKVTVLSPLSHIA